MAKNNAAQDTPTKDTPLGKERFVKQQDERLESSEGYGAGVKDKRNPAASTVPSSNHADTAKPIGQGKASSKTDRR